MAFANVLLISSALIGWTMDLAVYRKRRTGDQRDAKTLTTWSAHFVEQASTLCCDLRALHAPVRKQLGIIEDADQLVSEKRELVPTPLFCASMNSGRSAWFSSWNIGAVIEYDRPSESSA